jgi:hypothetical protein
VTVKEVGEKKQLDFEPSTTEGESELVGAAAGEEEAAS